MKFDIKKLKKDIKEIAIPIVAISLFIIIINSKFGKICPLRMLIGIPCPTCGTTRAVGADPAGPGHRLRGRPQPPDAEGPYGVEVTFAKTVHIIFPAAVRYVDLGSNHIIAGKADGAGIFQSLPAHKSVIFY